MYRESESESEIVVTVLTLLAANIKDREEIKRSEVSRDSFIELIYEEHVVVGSLLFYTCHFYVIVVLCQVSSGLDCICLKLFIKCYLKLKLLKNVNSSIVSDLHCYNF